MKKLLAIAALLSLSSTVHAQEGNSEFTHSAEYRVRYQFDQNVTGDEDTDPSSQDAFKHRFKFNTTFRASEQFSAHLSLLHNTTWGQGLRTTGDTADSDPAIRDGVGDGENMILVQEAYGTWMINDSMSLKFGRGSMTMGDGSVIAENDYEAHPYAFEGALLTYDIEMLRVSAFGIRFSEWNLADNTGSGVDDPETNAFGLFVDFKTLPEVLKMVNVYVLQHDSDEVYSGGASAIAKENQLRYGVAIGGDVSGFDFHLNYNAHTGETETGGTSTDKEGMMYQVELGYSLPDLMNSRFYALYHQDSGSSSGGSKNETYDPYFYDLHYNAGLMDVVNWGNLTYISVGYTLAPMDDTTFGIHYHMFSRTESDFGIDSGKNGGSLGLGGTSTATATNDEDKIGDEIDLTAEKKYDNGFSLLARIGMFMPGDYLKDAAIDKSDTYNQFFLQGKMEF